MLLRRVGGIAELPERVGNDILKTGARDSGVHVPGVNSCGSCHKGRAIPGSAVHSFVDGATQIFLRADTRKERSRDVNSSFNVLQHCVCVIISAQHTVCLFTLYINLASRHQRCIKDQALSIVVDSSDRTRAVVRCL